MTPADTCVWCERPFPTSAEYERDHPDSCDDDPSCWCTGYCWRNDGGICENAANEATKERLVSQLRTQIDSLTQNLEEHEEILGELSRRLVDQTDGFQKVIAAHVEVQVMHQRGFTLQCSDVGRGLWVKGSERVTAHEFAVQVTWDVNDVFVEADRGS